MGRGSTSASGEGEGSRRRRRRLRPTSDYRVAFHRHRRQENENFSVSPDSRPLPIRRTPFWTGPEIEVDGRGGYGGRVVECVCVSCRTSHKDLRRWNLLPRGQGLLRFRKARVGSFPCPPTNTWTTTSVGSVPCPPRNIWTTANHRTGLWYRRVSRY